MILLKKLGILPFILLLVFSCDTKKEPLIVATYTYSTIDRVKNLEPFAEELGVILNKSVEIKSYKDVAALVEGIKSGKVDVGFISTFGYLSLALDNDVMTPIATLKVNKEVENNYKTVLLANKNSNVDDIKALKQKAKSLSMLFVSKGSTSGNLIPRLFLSSIGINNPETQFRESTYGKNHTKTFEMVMNGETDLAAFGGSTYLEQVKVDSIISKNTKLLWVSDAIPLGPVLVKNNMLESDKKKITEMLVNIHKESPHILESIKGGWTEAKPCDKFISITDKYYDNFRKFHGNTANLENILNEFSK